MPKQEVFHLLPSGWESDPTHEFYELSTLDYCNSQVYTNYALFFKLAHEDKPKTISVLKQALGITLSQCRFLCGFVDEMPGGGLGFHKERDSTVEFHVQWLDGPGDEGKYPSFEELEKRHFVSQALGNINTWCVPPMTYGEKPEAHPASKPKVAAFKANFIPGGLVFMMHHHHYANDIIGWASELHQLAGNCAAVWNGANTRTLPAWDKAYLDRSRVTKPDVPEDQQIDGPVPPLRHTNHKDNQWLLFHLPKSRIQELKKLVSPEDGSYWISSYDAYMAYIRRVLSKLAWYIRQLTNSVTQEDLDVALSSIARVRDKTTLFLRTDSFPPMSNFTTDWRDSRPCEADFGFAKPRACRFPVDAVTAGLTIIHPVRSNGAPAGDDEGNEFNIGFEKELTQGLIEDPEWNKYFEFRGVDAKD